MYKKRFVKLEKLNNYSKPEQVYFIANLNRKEKRFPIYVELSTNNYYVKIYRTYISLVDILKSYNVEEKELIL